VADRDRRLAMLVIFVAIAVAAGGVAELVYVAFRALTG
jgi:hypothetical protein